MNMHDIGDVTSVIAVVPRMRVMTTRTDPRIKKSIGLIATSATPWVVLRSNSVWKLLLEYAVASGKFC